MTSLLTARTLKLLLWYAKARRGLDPPKMTGLLLLSITYLSMTLAPPLLLGAGSVSHRHHDPPIPSLGGGHPKARRRPTQEAPRHGQGWGGGGGLGGDMGKAAPGQKA